jgi:hypothetical protein
VCSQINEIEDQKNQKKEQIFGLTRVKTAPRQLQAAGLPELDQANAQTLSSKQQPTLPRSSPQAFVKMADPFDAAL